MQQKNNGMNCNIGADSSWPLFNFHPALPIHHSWPVPVNLKETTSFHGHAKRFQCNFHNSPCKFNQHDCYEFCHVCIWDKFLYFKKHEQLLYVHFCLTLQSIKATVPLKIRCKKCIYLIFITLKFSSYIAFLF